jgi:hypothetical protein
MDDDTSKDNRKRWFKDGLEFVEDNPLWFDPEHSYGIIPEQPKPTDLIYRLDYDADKGYLLLNTFVIQSFNWESNADLAFGELFLQTNSIVKTIDVRHPSKATTIVNNIKMPLTLRNAFFRTGNDGHRLQLTSEIDRERAKKFNVRFDEIDEYINKCRDKHYELLKTNKRK